MPKRKVIEDSDEEDNGSPSPEKTITRPDLKTNRAIENESPAASEDHRRSVGQSTASTDTLNREIRNAFKTLTEPTPNNSLHTTKVFVSSQQQSTASPSTSRSRMERSKTSVAQPRVKKPLKRYGSHNHDIFEFQGNSDAERDETARKEIGSLGATAKPSTQKEETMKASTWTLSSGDTEIIGTGDRYIPNATVSHTGVSFHMPPPAIRPPSFEQTQPVETSTLPKTDSTPLTWTPASLKSMKNTQPLNLNYSNDRRPTSSVSSGAISDKGQPLDTDSTDHTQKRLKLGMFMEASDGEQTELPEPSSSASIISPSRTITVSKKPHMFDPQVGDEAFGDNEVQSLDHLQPGSGIINPIVLLPHLLPHDEGQDELSLFISDPEPELDARGKTAKEIGGHVPKELGSDDIAIGLPKDQYQPRPSKSRSGRMSDDIVVPNDTQRPEARVRKNRKLQRRKTTAFHELVSKDEDEDEDEEEFEVVRQQTLEIPKRNTRKVLVDSDEEDLETKAGGDENQPKPPEEHEPAAKPQTPRKQRGRPKKGASEPTTIHSQYYPNKEIDGLLKDIVVDDTKASTSEGKPIGTEREFIAAEKLVPATKGKKGCKKGKAIGTPTVISEGLGRDSDGELAAVEEEQSSSRKILDEKDATISCPKPGEKMAASPPPPKIIQPPPETPRKTDSIMPKGPDKHSPISSGKVAYRVGLSKRARIAPLLRIVRK